MRERDPPSDSEPRKLTRLCKQRACASGCRYGLVQRTAAGNPRIGDYQGKPEPFSEPTMVALLRGVSRARGNIIPDAVDISALLVSFLISGNHFVWVLHGHTLIGTSNRISVYISNAPVWVSLVWIKSTGSIRLNSGMIDTGGGNSTSVQLIVPTQIQKKRILER